MIGNIIGNYRITGELARGGMGAVYRGRHQSLPREVVVKSILLSSFPSHAQDHLKARFVREAYIQSQLDHPNVVRVYEFFTTAENYYLVMEFIDGMSLRDLINRQGAMAPASAIPLFKQALSALDYANNFGYVDESGNRHTGIIHRDIKPANLLLDGMARLKITDFGIVKLSGERGMTQTGFNPGTVEYMSPEQIRGLEVDARSDLYSLGVTFYEALTGRLPFPPSDTGSQYEVLRGHIELAPPPLAAIKPDIPEALSALVMRSLEKDPNSRFQSASEFSAALLDYERNDAPTRRESPRAAPINPQHTHSMTEAISYDTRQAPVTAPGAPPRPHQRSIPTQATEPAPQRSILTQATEPAPQRSIPTQAAERPPINHHAAPPSEQPSRRYGLLIAGVFIAMLVVAGTAFMYLKRIGASSSTATNASTPTPTTSSTPNAAQEDARLKRARDAEKEERYYDAIILYGEYLAEHALDTNPRVKEIETHKTKLGEFYGLLNMGEFEMNRQDYAEAERNYTDALKLRPDSKLAQTGLDKAKARQAKVR